MPSPVSLRLAGLATLLFTPLLSHAAPAARPVVAGFERFYTGAHADAAAGGRLLVSELGCAGCHAGPADPGRKQAPVLDHVGGRVRVGWLRKYLADPQAVKPGATMPHVLAGDPAAKEKVEALVHLLASTGSVRHERGNPKAVAAGRDLYQKVGCFACHGTRDAAGEPATVLPTSVPLGKLKEKYSIGSLAGFLEQPHASRPSGRMPRLLNGAEARDVASYLLQGAKFTLAGGQGTANYEYYEGGWARLPNFRRIRPVGSGVANGFSLSAARRGNDYALKFDAFLKIDREGEYTFTLTSDDGSRLAIGGKTVVNNDGVHAPTTKAGRVRLTKGVHAVRLTFFQAGGGAELDARIEAPGFGQHALGDLVAATKEAFDKKPKVAADDPDALEIQPALVAKGKGLFASLGCANCHTLRENNKPVAPALKAADWAKLKADAGCLAAAPGKGAPVYGLDGVQRKAIAAALAAKAPAEKTPAAVIGTTMTTFNCYACHARAKVGGPEEAANKWFLTQQPEMGDEGRVPPPLDGVGAKLNADYFRRLLDQGVHDRPYMYTRMPGFGLANVGGLVDNFTALDKLPAVGPVAFKESPGKVRSAARHLVGGGAMGCIKCHTFGGIKAEGVQGIDMLLMPKRVRRDWFHAYVADPQRVRPGTRMPAAFINGKSVLPDILDGTARQQIEAMWLYLSDGSRALIPVGLGKHAIPLEPMNGAILYRNFIEGAGTRAIGVGYPERLNLAFDANELRLALLWQGAFIDAGRHWTDRGNGWQGPLGDNLLALPKGPAFAVLDKPDEAWPTKAPRALGYRFLGYRLTSDDRPTFNYAFNGVKVEDFPNPVGAGKDVHLRRTLTLSADKAPENLYFRAAVGDKAAALPGGWYQIDGWKIKPAKGVAARLRKSGGKTELLLSVRFTGGKAALTCDYAW